MLVYLYLFVYSTYSPIPLNYFIIRLCTFLIVILNSDLCFCHVFKLAHSIRFLWTYACRSISFFAFIVNVFMRLVCSLHIFHVLYIHVFHLFYAHVRDLIFWKFFFIEIYFLYILFSPFSFFLLRICTFWCFYSCVMLSIFLFYLVIQCFYSIWTFFRLTNFSS